MHSRGSYTNLDTMFMSNACLYDTAIPRGLIRFAIAIYNYIVQICSGITCGRVLNGELNGEVPCIEEKSS